ncbi:MAG: cytochrome c oxidase subunit II [Planctomycetia bacterium]
MKRAAAGFWALLFLGFAVLVVASFVLAPRLGWWLPEGKSSFAASTDALIHTILWVMGAFFVLTLGLLVLFIWRQGDGSSAARSAKSSDLRLELLWTVLPAGVLAWLALTQIDEWKAMKFSTEARREPISEVWASQFDWRMRHPGADGLLGSADDWELPYEVVVPAGEEVRLSLRSRDVIHSFFVPAFRLKQDIVPGRVMSVWFTAEAGEYELVCAELCGWGHYKMAGRVRVLPPEEYQAFVQRQNALQQSGAEVGSR